MIENSDRFDFVHSSSDKNVFQSNIMDVTGLFQGWPYRADNSSTVVVTRYLNSYNNETTCLRLTARVLRECSRTLIQPVSG